MTVSFAVVAESLRVSLIRTEANGNRTAAADEKIGWKATVPSPSSGPNSSSHAPITSPAAITTTMARTVKYENPFCRFTLHSPKKTGFQVASPLR